MQSVSTTPILSAVFVDYDNIYLSLRRKNEEAAKRFAKDAGRWIAGLQSGELITPTGAGLGDPARRLVMNRCYGNPVPRRNPSDNSTDMSSFPFVRHHFLRSGFEIIDCPPLTAQLKNSSDIKMVMDLRDFLTHATHFEEFIILSSDADFTPVLHRLRAHNRRTVIFANDNTAAPYTALADGEVREQDLIDYLLGELQVAEETAPSITVEPEADAEPVDISDLRDDIVSIVAEEVRQAPKPLPLEIVAERATRVLGHDATVGSAWGGSGSFLELLRADLPDDIGISSQQPPVLFDRTRLKSKPMPKQIEPAVAAAPEPAPPAASEPVRQAAAKPQMAATRQTVPETPTVDPQQAAEEAEALQRSIAKIHEASQAPPISPPDYRILFEEMAGEITENELQGVQTIANVVARAGERGVSIQREDVRFILDVVGEADPWFEQGATANLFAGRFRNFVVARCRSQGLTLSTGELDLIETWFASPPGSARNDGAKEQDQPARWWDEPEPTQPAQADEAPTSYESGGAGDVTREDMPRFVRSHPRL